MGLVPNLVSNVTWLEAVSAAVCKRSHVATQAMSKLRRARCWTSMRASCRSVSASCVHGFLQETADRSSGCASGLVTAMAKLSLQKISVLYLP